MKIEITRKAIKESGCKVYRIGYCQAQYLLGDKNPTFYNCGVYGWNCDYYVFEEKNIILSMGYNPQGQALKDYNMLRKYENKALKLTLENMPYETRKKKLAKLLNQFLDEIVKE